MVKGGQTAKDPVPPRTRAAWQLKDAGDVVAARREAARILADNPTPEEKAEAEELLSRSSTPAALYGFAALAALILTLLVVLAATRY
jgi:hypothetical protein